jgi:hypothetical protein
MVLRSLIVALALLATPLAAAPFRTLFDGTSLDGWTAVGDANWTLRDGVVSADKGAISFLVSKERFRDFELRVEFWVSEDANSGIFIRCIDATPRMELDNAYEVNIFDTRPDPTYGTGAIVTVAAVSPMPKAGGHWNTYLIRAEGDRFTVTLNGQKTVDGARDSRFREGVIGLQYGAGIVKFRKVEIRQL